MTNWNDEKECLEAVKQDGYALKYVKNQTREICLAAVKQKPDTIKYIRNVQRRMDTLRKLGL